MKQGMKMAGWALVPVAVASLVGGGVLFGQVSGDREYWENKAARSEADLATLETGLGTLKNNQVAYLEGRVAYEQGLRDYEQGQQDLAEGKAEYEAGKATLSEKQGEYDAGVAQLAAAEPELVAGKKKLDENYQAYVSGKERLRVAEAELAAGKAELDANYQAYVEGKARIVEGEPQLEVARTTIAESEAKLTAVKPLVEAIQSVNAAYQEWSSGYQALLDFQQKVNVSGSQSLAAPSADNATAYEQAIEAASQKDPVARALIGLPERLKTGKSTIAESVKNIFNQASSNTELANQIAAAIGVNMETYSSAISKLFSDNDYASYKQDMDQISLGSKAVLEIYDQGVQDLAAGKQEFAVKEQELINGKAQVAAYEQGQAEYNAGLAEYQAGKAQVSEYEAGLAEYQAGLAEYTSGKARLEEGAVQLAAGREELAEAEQTIAQGEADLAAAEEQLASGKAQLLEYEDGQDQAMDGLDTVLATETYGDLASISDRLGSDFRYADVEGNLVPEQGLAAVQTAREFAADNTAAVTRDLTGKMMVAVALVAIGLVALGVSYLAWNKARKD